MSYRLGRRLAHEVVVQTEDQVAMAAENISHPVRLIRSFCELPSERHEQREAFLWIGGFIDYKDPLAYVALAERLPDVPFWMVGHSRGPEWDDLKNEVEAAAARLPNLELLPPRSRARLLELYPKAVAVVSTSLFEGFPNVFLEAWAHGTPVLSLRVDPENVIRRYGLGAVAEGSSDRLAEEARALWERRHDLASEGAAGRTYVAEAHMPEAITDQWATLLRSLSRR
jgi:glycosyltransferase involved in cell wall biosynthesis